MRGSNRLQELLLMPFELLRKSAFYVAVMYLILEFLIFRKDHANNKWTYIMKNIVYILVLSLSCILR